MFAYCNNMPVICADWSGFDAVILVDEDFVTHIGIMAQGKDGTWWHFYWGSGADGGTSSNGSLGGSSSASSGYILTILGDVPPKTWNREYSGNLTLDEINSSGQYVDYEDMLYLSGDFSGCIAEMQNPRGQYNLYNRNCSQVSLGILATAETKHQDILSDASKIFYPKNAFDVLRVRSAIRSRLDTLLGVLENTA